MCEKLSDFRLKLPEGGARYIKLPCGHCWQCLGAKTDDLVGRCLCEARVSDWTVCVNLTYANSAAREVDGAHRLLFPKHAQDFIKRLRNDRLLVRYLIVGEYGSKRGRSHFHAILFGRVERPSWPEGMSHDDRWPHGHIEVDWSASERSMRYAVKYLRKGRSDQVWKSQSKEPALGVPYIVKLAEHDAAQGILPPDFRYYPPDAAPGRKYYLTGAARREYLLRWVAVRGGVPLDHAHGRPPFVVAALEALDSWLARKARKPSDAVAALDRWAGNVASRRRVRPNFEYLDEVLERAHYDARRATGGVCEPQE